MLPLNWNDQERALGGYSPSPLTRPPIYRAKEMGAIASPRAVRGLGRGRTGTSRFSGFIVGCRCGCFAQQQCLRRCKARPMRSTSGTKKARQQRRSVKKSGQSGTRVSLRTSRRCRERRKAPDCRRFLGALNYKTLSLIQLVKLAVETVSS